MVDQALNMSPNGHETVEEEAVSTTASPQTETPGLHIDAVRGVIITRSGVELELSGAILSSLFIERLANQGKPRIPMVEVTRLGKHKSLEPNPKDEAYLAALDEWRVEANTRTLRYLFTKGIKGSAPDEFVAEHRSYFPDADDQEFKYLWIMSLVEDADIEDFTDAVMGRYIPTQKGMEEAANFTT
jgi:hypothetical protein